MRNLCKKHRGEIILLSMDELGKDFTCRQHNTVKMTTMLIHVKMYVSEAESIRGTCN